MIRLAVYILWFTCTAASIIEGQYYFTPLFALATIAALPEKGEVQ